MWRATLSGWLFARLAAALAAGLLAGLVYAAAPTVSLTVPAQGSFFPAPATIALAATASDSDGTISQVEFFQGTMLLATVTAAPYTFNWTNVATGTYSLTAKATDNAGLTTTSSPVPVTVDADLIAGSLNFFYDELGRLVGVSDAAGKGATYAYDAVGNVLSIARTAGGAVSIAEFTPNSGPIGATVTGQVSAPPWPRTRSNSMVLLRRLLPQPQAQLSQRFRPGPRPARSVSSRPTVRR